MVQLPTGPTISCSIGSSPVAVIATYKGGLLPVSGASVTFFHSSVAFRTDEYVTATTNLVGLAEVCLFSPRWVQARIQKSGVDFGSGIGKQHIIGSKSGFDRVFSQVFLIQALTPPPGVTPPPVVIPCFGTLSVSQPNFFEILNIRPPLPPSINVSPVTATVNDRPENIPIKIYVDGREYPFAASANTSIDVMRIIKYFGIDEINKGHTITIESAKTGCNISPNTGSFSVPPLIPALPALPAPCTVFDTTANIFVPSVLQAPFNIDIRDAFWICRDTGEKIPVNVPAEVFIAGQKFTIPLS